MAPVELIGLAGIKAQRHVSGRGPPRLLALPSPGMAAHRIVAALIAEASKLLVEPNQRQPLTPGLAFVLGQQPLQIGGMGAELRHGLHRPLVAERA